MNKNRSFDKDFQYSHKNIYHDKLSDFDQFVMRDLESEEHANKWNSDIFNNNASIEVEIGSGYGHFMMNYCPANPKINFIGIDYRFKRTFQVAKQLAKFDNKNFRFLRAKGERIGFIFGENEIDVAHYYFPDPWPKARHQKKRLFQRPFLEALHKTLKPGGVFLIKTDHDGYGEWMDEVLEKSSDLFEIVMKTKNLYKDFPEHRIAQFQTKFEKIFLKQNIFIKAYELKSKK